MTGERVAGLLVTIGYTLAAIAAINPLSSGAMQDTVAWIAWVFLILAGTSYVLPDRTVLSLAGAGKEFAIRGAALGIQLILFGYAGWWWIFAVRLITEGISGHRVLLAQRCLRQSFKVGENQVGETYIHCYGCGNSSYHPKDIENHYCGYCHKFHHREISGDGQQRAAAT